MPQTQTNHIMRLIGIPSKSKTSPRNHVDNIAVPSEVAACHHDKVRVCVFELPIELLIDIMLYLNGRDLFCLRQASAIFLRLFSHSSFLTWHSPEVPTIQTKKDPPLWPQFEISSLAVEDRRWLRKALARDKYCQSCRELRTTDAYSTAVDLLRQPLRCGACQTEHPAILFSAAERRVQESVRSCVGRQGHVSVCAHKALTWDELESAKNGNAVQDLRRPDQSTATKGWRTDGRRPKCPQVSLKPVGSSRQEIDVIITSKVHVWDLDVGQSFGPEELDKTLLLCDKLEDPDVSICPHVSFNDRRVRSAFKQTQCDCPVPQRASWGSLHLNRQIFGQHSSSSNSVQLFHRETRCSHDAYQLTCLQCLATYTVTSRNKQVWLETTRPILRPPSPTSFLWIQSLDPSSFGLYEDELSRHITWCEAPRCETNFRMEEFMIILLRCRVTGQIRLSDNLQWTYSSNFCAEEFLFG